MSAEVFKVGSIWHYRFQVRPFKRVQRSTRMRDRKRATIVAERAYADAVTRERWQSHPDAGRAAGGLDRVARGNLQRPPRP